MRQLYFFSSVIYFLSLRYFISYFCAILFFEFRHLLLNKVYNLYITKVVVTDISIFLMILAPP
ncbi:uncharacterized protein BX664DRAFT_100406 [Halteromyces radiatus]|uniref:uncharacterized protein n=1 Tax=Halteromyces radiatus TaxID=101107 RepID=UPI00221FDEBF|nr:uncharacterized protein BX664DRAFT_100406 [Halteromyces radiatus]KAI8093086.1 hypothetical protein BX664DRAFT_100406 [Halteromyces radiatus]